MENNGADEIGEVLFDERTIADRIAWLASGISADYRGKELVLVCVLKGAALFCADLARALNVPATVEFIQVSSYGGRTSSSGGIALHKDAEQDLAGKQVLLVDTIIDTGTTMSRLFSMFASRGPASLKAVVLLDKQSRRTSDVPIAYAGLPIPDLFVVGYGMDYGERFRSLPYIAVLNRPEA